MNSQHEAALSGKVGAGESPHVCPYTVALWEVAMVGTITELSSEMETPVSCCEVMRPLPLTPPVPRNRSWLCRVDTSATGSFLSFAGAAHERVTGMMWLSLVL